MLHDSGSPASPGDTGRRHLCRCTSNLFDVCEPGEAFSVARYVELADAAAQDILSRGMTPIVVGGTGLYMDALIECSVFSGDAVNASSTIAGMSSKPA